MCLVTTTHNNDNDSNNRGIHFVVCSMISWMKEKNVTNKEAMFYE